MAARTTAARAPATTSELELPMVRRKLWVHNLYYSMRSWVASFRSVATLCSSVVQYLCCVNVSPELSLDAPAALTCPRSERWLLYHKTLGR